MDLSRVGLKRFLDLNELEELRNDAYINSKIANKKLKRWHDQLISHKDFQKEQRVLLYDSKLHIFPGKLKSRWIGLFTIHQVHSNGVVELLNSNSTESFKVNGHHLKPFVEPFSRDKEEFILLDPHQVWQDQFFFMDLVFQKTIESIFFLFYFLFGSFPVLLLVFILISRFNFILVWFNLGFLWSITGGTSKQLGVSLKILGRGKTNTIRTPCKIFVGHAKFMAHFAWDAKILHGMRKFCTGCENFAHTANQFLTPCEPISHTL